MRVLKLSTYRAVLCALCFSTLLIMPLAAAIGPAPSIASFKSLNTADGAAIDITDFRGNVVAIWFWSAAQRNNTSSIPHVEKLYEEFRKDGFVVVGHTDGSSSNLEGIIKDNNVQYPMSIGKDLGKAYAIKEFPQVVVVDPNGNVAWMGHPNLLNSGMVRDYVKAVPVYAKDVTRLPTFARPSSVPRVAKIEAAIAAGEVGAGVSYLKQMIKKDNDTVAAQASLDQVQKWIAAVNKKMAGYEQLGDIYYACQICGFMVKTLKGSGEEDVFKDKLRALQKLDGFKAAKDYQRFATVSIDQRDSPAYKAAVQKFIDAYKSGYYVDQARAMLK